MATENPTARTTVEHRSPSAIAADVAAKEQRILVLMEGIQGLLEPAAAGAAEDAETEERG